MCSRRCYEAIASAKQQLWYPDRTQLLEVQAAPAHPEPRHPLLARLPLLPVRNHIVPIVLVALLAFPVIPVSSHPLRDLLVRQGHRNHAGPGRACLLCGRLLCGQRLNLPRQTELGRRRKRTLTRFWHSVIIRAHLGSLASRGNPVEVFDLGSLRKSALLSGVRSEGSSGARWR